MTRPRQKQTDDDEAPGPGGWIVTFSDCMTLLLCFFVMLVSFSSFDEASLRKIAWAFRTKALDSISDSRHSVRDSFIPPRPRAFDHTRAGSNTPTDMPRKNIRNPRASGAPLSAEAHWDKQVMYLASPRLFWGNGASLTQPGRELLKTVASFMKVIACDAVIGEIPGAAESHDDPAAITQRGLDRSFAAVQYLTTRKGLPVKRFHVSARHGVAPARYGDKPVLVITLLSRSVHR